MPLCMSLQCLWFMTLTIIRFVISSVIVLVTLSVTPSDLYCMLLCLSLYFLQVLCQFRLIGSVNRSPDYSPAVL
jgi:hypothetical protein